MMAATGKQLKQSVKVFHSRMLYLRLPGMVAKKQVTYYCIRWLATQTYIHHKSQTFCLLMHTHDFLEVERNSLGTWSCTPAASKWFQLIASPSQCNSQGRDSWPQEGNHRTQTYAAGHSTAHVCHLNTMVDKDGQKVGNSTLHKSESTLIPKSWKLWQTLKGWTLQ